MYECANDNKCISVCECMGMCEYECANDNKCISVCECVSVRCVDVRVC